MGGFERRTEATVIPEEGNGRGEVKEMRWNEVVVKKMREIEESNGGERR